MNKNLKAFLYTLAAALGLCLTYITIYVIDNAPLWYAIPAAIFICLGVLFVVIRSTID